MFRSRPPTGQLLEKEERYWSLMLGGKGLMGFLLEGEVWSQWVEAIEDGRGGDGGGGGGPMGVGLHYENRLLLRSVEFSTNARVVSLRSFTHWLSKCVQRSEMSFGGWEVISLTKANRTGTMPLMLIWGSYAPWKQLVER